MSAPRYAFNAEIFALLAVGLAAVVLRLYLRARAVGGLKGLASDDCLVVLAAVAYGTETALAYVAENEANGLTSSFMDDGTRAAMAPQTGGREHRQRVLGSKLQLGSWASHSIVIWSLKAAVCVLCLRLASTQHRRRRPAALLGLALVGASWLGATLTLLLSCRPMTRMWRLSPAPEPSCQPASSPALIWTYMSLGVATYLYLMAVPAPSLFQTGAPARHKLLTAALLACGFLAGLAAVNRAVVVSVRALFVVAMGWGAELFTYRPDACAQSFRDLRLARKWEAREAFAAMVTANMAIILPCWMEGPSRIRESGDGNQDSPTTPMSQVGRKDGEGAAVETTYVEDGEVASPHTGSGEKDGRGIQRRVEVCVREDDEVYLVKNGNYTGVWSGAHGGRQTRSRYFGDHIHQLAYPGA
ncbi:hypothetical protein HRG_009010 [Hirsutella rhossiliensis]|uniref:Rhodopsin domain-containing protein n=1 Tax=Hirsutella rhossiliensis TaxID=111463 RepID=A0A9P8SFF4_9HYPO|nr:uncharacterized protein HRG_09010 [Hirsutella rhossiliensis]KAH0959989.1 hypothetical protein HRG_09010 [Hirsutella rhossiliensis]